MNKWIVISVIQAGAVALLLSKQPSCTNMMVKRLLCETAFDLGLGSRQQGFGRIDVGRLLGLN